ncbi:MAG: hypothetical protein K6347_01065 [Campylobacterales bacterium]
MFLDWLILSIVSLLCLYLYARMLYFKNLAEKERAQSRMVNNTLTEAEALIRKHQIQLQRSLGNIEVLNEELSKLRNDVKILKSRNSQYRVENERLKNKIRVLENKIEALL